MLATVLAGACQIGGAAPSVAPPSPAYLAGVLGVSTLDIRVAISTPGENAELKARLELTGDILWTITCRDGEEGILTMTLFEGNAQTGLVGLAAGLTDADHSTYRDVKQEMAQWFESDFRGQPDELREVVGASYGYQRFPDGTDCLIYPSGAAPGKSAYSTMLSLRGETCDLLVTANASSGYLAARRQQIVPFMKKLAVELHRHFSAP